MQNYVFDATEDAPEKLYQVHDKGYKRLFRKLQVFLGFLYDFMGLPRESTVLDVTSLETEYVLFVIELNGITREWLVMVEFQRTEDPIIDLRFLEYELQAMQSKIDAWRLDLAEAPRPDQLRLPTVKRVVLYNGLYPRRGWHERISLSRDITAEWGDESVIKHQLVQLLDVHRLPGEKLQSMRSCMSKVFWIEQVLEVHHIETIRRLKVLPRYLDKLSDDEYDALMDWFIKSKSRRCLSK